MSPHSVFGELLGIPADLTATTVLSHRIVRRVALAQANAVRFFWELSIPIRAPGLSVRCDDQYTITPQRTTGTLAVRNVVRDTESAMSGFTLVFELKRELFGQSRSTFQAQRLAVGGLAGEVHIDGQPLVVEKLRIEKTPTAVRVIVGRHRHDALVDVGAPTPTAVGARGLAAA